MVATAVFVICVCACVRGSDQLHLSLKTLFSPPHTHAHTDFPRRCSVNGVPVLLFHCSFYHDEM